METVRCLVTGGSGFFGRHLATALFRDGHAVRVASRTPPDRTELGWPDGIIWTQTDLRNERCDWDALVADCDVVFHLAWTSLPAFSNSEPARDVQENVVSGLRLLQALSKVPATRLVFVSSGGYVYGRTPHLPIAEDCKTPPICAYGLSKLTFEHYLAIFADTHGLDYRVLRVSNAFGAGQDTSRPQGVVTTFLDRAIKALPIEIWGDGSVVRDHVHISDIVAALRIAGTIDAAAMGGHRIFNIGSGAGRSVNEIVDTLRRIGFAVAPTYRSGRSFDVPANVLDIALAARVLQWRPLLNFEQGLAQTAYDLGWRGHRSEARRALG
jgi:UDP-glucose 4-epimerase